MDNIGHLHRYIYFYQNETQLAFAATTSGSALVIDRATAKLSLQGPHLPQDFMLIVVLNTASYPPSETVYGILGTIRLRLGIVFVVEV